MGLSTKNNEEFEQLALPLLDSLYNFAHWLTHDREEAEDLVQETYAKALRGFHGFTPGTNFRAWMFRILRNAFLNSRTGLAARMTVPLEEEEQVPIAVVENETPESLLLSRLSAEALQGAIDDLPVHYREVVLLCDVEEMRYADAATALDVPIGTVMSRLSRARRMLRKALSGTHGVATVSGRERK